MKTDQPPPENAEFVAAAIERHQQHLLRYAARLLGQDAAAAREVVAAAFARLKAMPVDEVEDELAEWLFAACRKRAFEILHREGRMKRFEAGDDGHGAAVGPAAADAAEAEEAHVTMQRLIERLTPKQQEAMRLKFQDGFGHKEIAYITDLSPTNAGNLVHNAVVRLARDFHASRAAPGAAGSHLAGREDPRLTLFALGELEDRERRNFENSLFDRKAAGAKVDEIKATCALIGKTLAIETGAPAPRTVRRPKRKRRRGVALWLGFPRVLLVLGGLAAVAGAAVFLIRKATADEMAAPAATPVEFRLKASPWEAGAPADDAAGPLPAASGNRAENPGNGRDLPAPSRALAPAMPRARENRAPALRGTAATGAVSREAPAEIADGAPSGPVPFGVTAIPRGKRGEVQKTAGHVTETAEPPGRVSAVSGAAAAAPAPPVDTPAAKTGSPPPPVERAAARPAATAQGGPKAVPEKRTFASAREAPVSQLPADTDTASISEMKRTLSSGRWPAAGSVKVEEMLNYYPYRYAPPAAPADFAPAMESSEAPWAPAHRLVRIGLKAREASTPPRAAANLILLVDTSGSMAAPNRLPLVKEAVRLLLAHLRPDDRVGVVTYAGESRLTLLPTPVTETRKILEALDRLEAKGLTNGGAGLELAYDLAQAHAVPDGVNCVILCTDGDFNVGPVSEADLTRLVDKRAKTSVRLSIFGFGRNGRIDPRLEALAAHGRGGSGYVNTRREAEQVLTAQLNGLFAPVATDLKVEVAFNPASVKGYRVIGYDDQGGELQDRGAAPPSGPILPGHALTALYEVEPADGISPGAELLQLRVKYRVPGDGGARQLVFPLRDHPEAFAAASLDFKFAAAVAAFGQALNNPPGQGSVSLDQVEAWGRECLGDDAGGYRTEFLALVAQAKAARR